MEFAFLAFIWDEGREGGGRMGGWRKVGKTAWLGIEDEKKAVEMIQDYRSSGLGSHIIWPRKTEVELVQWRRPWQPTEDSSAKRSRTIKNGKGSE